MSYRAGWAPNSAKTKGGTFASSCFPTRLVVIGAMAAAVESKPRLGAEERKRKVFGEGNTVFASGSTRPAATD